MPTFDFDHPAYYGEWDALVDLARSLERDQGECPEHLRPFLVGGDEPQDVEGFHRRDEHYWRGG
jgi:hypothetical protein